MEQQLKTKCRLATTIEFRGDAYKYLFHGKGIKQEGWIFLQSSDFPAKYFPYGWDKLCDQHGQGSKLHYPVKLRHFLSWSPKKFAVNSDNGSVVTAKRVCLEKLSFMLVKVAA